MKFNLLTKYILIYVSVAIIGFVGVTVISYKIDYNRVYSEQTENMYRQAVSIAAEFAPDYFSNDKLKLIQLELHTITELDHSRIMFVDMDGNVILDTQYNNMNEEVDENGFAHITQRNKFTVGEMIEIMKPDGRNIPVTVEAIYNEEGEAMESAPHAQQRIYVKLTEMPEVFDILRRGE